MDLFTDTVCKLLDGGKDLQIKYQEQVILAKIFVEFGDYINHKTYGAIRGGINGLTRVLFSAYLSTTFKTSRSYNEMIINNLSGALVTLDSRGMLKPKLERRTGVATF
jgi:hypothetical protein